jgi:Zn ribbon nucleic-acid-binding protein
MNACLKHLSQKKYFPESNCTACDAEENIREWEEKYGELTIFEFAEKRENGEL